jgi:hypothetical protein
MIHLHGDVVLDGGPMSITPFTLKYLEITASRRGREHALERRSSGFGHFLLIPLFWLFFPFIIIYELLRMRQS